MMVNESSVDNVCASSYHPDNPYNGGLDKCIATSDHTKAEEEARTWRDFAKSLPSAFQFLVKHSTSAPSLRTTQPPSLVASWLSAGYQPRVREQCP